VPVDTAVSNVVRGMWQWFGNEITACSSVSEMKKFNCGFGISGYDLFVAASGLGVTALKLEEQ